MMTPDSRPIGVLTPTILATASHWCIHRKGIADIRPASTLVLRVSDFDDDLPLLTCEGECYWNDDSNWMCYPCTLQPNGLVVPEPWPVLDGEERIDEWFKYHHDRRPAFRKITDIYTDPRMWVLLYADGKRAMTAKAMSERPGFHPAPRRDSDGFTVWVWEKDR